MARLAGLAIIDMTPKAMNCADWQLGIRDGYNEDNGKATLESICRDWHAHCQYFPFALLNTDAESSLAEWIIDEVHDNSADVMASLWQSLISKDYRELLPNIAIPSIIIAGGDSPLYELATAEYLITQLPDARLKVLAGCGHGPPMQQPQQC
ncbi:MAG: alpha/beta hydrolase, partial [Chloroflexi bacterium]|nr:alpha/beta hydrolase [Chloroflexota bacterium]